MGPCHRSPTALRFHCSHRLPYKRMCHNLANSAKLQWAPGPHHHHHCHHVHHHHLTSQISDGAAPRTKRTLLDLSSKSTHLYAWNFLFFRPILGLVRLGFSIILPPFYPSFRKKKYQIFPFYCAHHLIPIPGLSPLTSASLGSPQLSFLQPPPLSLADLSSVCPATPCLRCIAAFRIHTQISFVQHPLRTLR
ncbi:hypothetical protein DER46DRAFT_51103 [Fusarium sp. MPI-SDFR-AT-0072]|nr:hypothetical protein DER46DRAFT_51103 [Fusarium sp. MPI-SDFR-AT-0072]